MLLLLACAPSEDAASPAPAAEETHGWIEAVDGRDVLHLSGTREEMGYAEGSLVCDRVAPLFEAYVLDHLITEYSDYGYEVARPYVLAMVRFEDADLRELEAMWRGATDTCTPEQLTVTSEHLEPGVTSRVLEYEDLLFANAIADFGCSSFTAWGAASATGETLHGRNFDWAVDDEGAFLDNHLVKVYDSEEEGGARFASLLVPGLAGCVTCVTEEGVGLTMHNVGGLEPSREFDISPRILAARAAMVATWQADDVVVAAEDALEARQQIVGSNLHLSFPTARGGGIGGVVLEYDGAADAPDGQVTVRRPGDDPDYAGTDGIVATNHFVTREPPESSGDSADRHHALLADLAEGGLDADSGRVALAGVARRRDGLTAHSIVIDTAARELRVFVAPDPTTPAPDVEPVVLGLDALFD
ncbi:MAG: hypothetical protein ACOZNI_05285 [Myxococcota bacterium]